MPRHYRRNTIVTLQCAMRVVCIEFNRYFFLSQLLKKKTGCGRGEVSGDAAVCVVYSGVVGVFKLIM